jgi:hypothetical protein
MWSVPMNFSRERLLRAVIGCALGLAVISAAPARAEDDAPAEDKLMDSIMGAFGLTRGGNTIDYRERSPLVIPRDSNLPAPTSAAIQDPNWPVDPEVKEAKALAAARHKDDGRTSSQRMDDNMRPLSRAELDKGRTLRRQQNPHVSSDNQLLPSSWSDLGYHGGLFGIMFSSGNGEDLPKFTGEPPRTSLTEPPVGYQTPSPNQPYAAAKDRSLPKAIDPYGERKYER